MSDRRSWRTCAALLVLVLAALPSCSKKNKNPTPTGPGVDPNAGMYGTWIGTLAGPDSLQPSGWSGQTRDSVWVMIHSGSVKFYMAPTGHAPSLSQSPDSCFVQFPAALSELGDPDVSFRVNFSQSLTLGTAVPVEGIRNGRAITGHMFIPGDSTAGTWTATLCTTCPDTAKSCQ